MDTLIVPDPEPVVQAPESLSFIKADPNTEAIVLNVTLLEPRLKHPSVFKQLDALHPGAAFILLNDHDPKPLYYQMVLERGNVFTWTYLEEGPQWWRVLIQKNESAILETIGEI